MLSNLLANKQHFNLCKTQEKTSSPTYGQISNISILAS